MIDTLINHVHSHSQKNALYLNSSLLYKDNGHAQQKIVGRLGVFLLFVLKMAEEGTLSKTECKNFTTIITDQIRGKEFHNIKGIYNVKKALEYVEPEHTYLSAINNKASVAMNKGSVSF